MGRFLSIIVGFVGIGFLAACGGTTVAGDQCKPGCDGNIPFTCGEDGQPNIGIACGDGEACTQGVCVPAGSVDTIQPDVACEPLCITDGDPSVVLECGDDGCGGSCGDCNEGEDCAAGLCIGDTCVPNCDEFDQAKNCGPDGCGGTCGECADGEACNEGFCSCAPDCEGHECGDDGCGGNCGICDKSTNVLPSCEATVKNDGGNQCVPIGDHCKNAIPLKLSNTAGGSFTQDTPWQVVDGQEGTLKAPTDHHTLVSVSGDCKFESVPKNAVDQVWKYTPKETCTFRLQIASPTLESMHVYVATNCTMDDGCVAAHQFDPKNVNFSAVLPLKKGETYFIILETEEALEGNVPGGYKIGIEKANCAG